MVSAGDHLAGVHKQGFIVQSDVEEDAADAKDFKERTATGKDRHVTGVLLGEKDTVGRNWVHKLVGHD